MISKMKYERVYKKYKTRVGFVRHLRLIYRLSRATAERTYLRYKYNFGLYPDFKGHKYYKEKLLKEDNKPDTIKMLNYYDLYTYGYDVTIDKLKKMGFTDKEIQWLRENENLKV